MSGQTVPLRPLNEATRRHINVKAGKNIRSFSYRRIWLELRTRQRTRRGFLGTLTPPSFPLVASLPPLPSYRFIVSDVKLQREISLAPSLRFGLGRPPRSHTPTAFRAIEPGASFR